LIVEIPRCVEDGHMEWSVEDGKLGWVGFSYGLFGYTVWIGLRPMVLWG